MLSHFPIDILFLVFAFNFMCLSFLELLPGLLYLPRKNTQKIKEREVGVHFILLQSPGFFIFIIFLVDDPL